MLPQENRQRSAWGLNQVLESVLVDDEEFCGRSGRSAKRISAKWGGEGNAPSMLIEPRTSSFPGAIDIVLEVWTRLLDRSEGLRLHSRE